MVDTVTRRAFLRAGAAGLVVSSVPLIGKLTETRPAPEGFSMVALVDGKWRHFGEGVLHEPDGSSSRPYVTWVHLCRLEKQTFEKLRLFYRGTLVMTWSENLPMTVDYGNTIAVHWPVEWH